MAKKNITPEMPATAPVVPDDQHPDYQAYLYGDDDTEAAAEAGGPVPGIPGTPQDNAAITRAILAGETGPRRDLAVLNAGAAIYAGGKAGSLAAGVVAAQEAIDGGAAASALEKYVTLSHELGAKATA